MNLLARAPILEQLAILSDTTRARMVGILERHELTVSELCDVLQLPQSTVSRHLKALADGGWVASRREGTSRFYSLALDELDSGSQRLWPLVREQVAATAAGAQDARRLSRVLALRPTTSEAFFASAAGQWDRLREELFGPVSALHGLLALADPSWVVGDLGCGTGQVSEALAPFVRRVVAVDRSAEMLAAAKSRLSHAENVDVRLGSLEQLPLDTHSLDVACLMLVLHYVGDPRRVLDEAHRVVRPAGRVIVLDMLPHDHEDYRQGMGHVWLGFSATQMTRLLGQAGFTHVACRSLPPDPRAKGPSLFVATGTSVAGMSETDRLDRRTARTRSDT